MPEINWELRVQVVGGPQISAAQTIIVEAYDTLQVTVEPGVSNKAVQVQPGGAGQVKLLLISSNRYDGNKLSYKPDIASGAITLDAPQLLIGTGAVGLLNPPPQTLLFSSTLSEDASIQILVGRDATP